MLMVNGPIKTKNRRNDEASLSSCTCYQILAQRSLLPFCNNCEYIIVVLDNSQACPRAGRFRRRNSAACCARPPIQRYCRIK